MRWHYGRWAAGKVGKRPPCLSSYVFKWEDVCVWRRRRDEPLSFAFVFVSAALLTTKKNEKIPVQRCVRVWAAATKKQKVWLDAWNSIFYSFVCCQNTLFQSPRLTRWQWNWRDGVLSTHPELPICSLVNFIHPWWKREVTRAYIGPKIETFTYSYAIFKALFGSELGD